MDRLEAWKVVEREVVFAGGPVEVVREAVLLPDGRTIPDFYSVSIPSYALVYAVTDQAEVLMFRQYRHGPRAICLSFPGGHIQAGEDPEATATRELLEETGYRAGRLTPLGHFTVCANQGCATAHLFRADACERVQEPESGDLEQMELIKIASHDVLSPSHFSQIRVISHATLALLAVAPVSAQR
jgi:ADP-ribose pyrophosphatase